MAGLRHRTWKDVRRQEGDIDLVLQAGQAAISDAMQRVGREGGEELLQAAVNGALQGVVRRP